MISNFPFKSAEIQRRDAEARSLDGRARLSERAVFGPLGTTRPAVEKSVSLRVHPWLKTFRLTRDAVERGLTGGRDGFHSVPNQCSEGAKHRSQGQRPWYRTARISFALKGQTRCVTNPLDHPYRVNHRGDTVPRATPSATMERPLRPVNGGAASPSGPFLNSASPRPAPVRTHSTASPMSLLRKIRVHSCNSCLEISDAVESVPARLTHSKKL